VGLIRHKLIDKDGMPELRIMIEQDYRSTLRTTSRFWSLPATSMNLGQHGFKLDVQGVDALVQGALAFDHFDRGGMEVSNDALLELSATEFAARSAGRRTHHRGRHGRSQQPG
jgi:paraquat-inducible protein B